MKNGIVATLILPILFAGACRGEKCRKHYTFTATALDAAGNPIQDVEVFYNDGLLGRTDSSGVLVEHSQTRGHIAGSTITFRKDGLQAVNAEPVTKGEEGSCGANELKRTAIMTP